MDGDGHACISDCGLGIILHDEARARPIECNARWAAPEVLDAPNKRIPLGDDGKAVDIYSLGMIMFEVRPSTLPLSHALILASPRS